MTGKASANYLNIGTPPFSMQLQQWYHVAVSVSRNIAPFRATFYVNGEIVETYEETNAWDGVPIGKGDAFPKMDIGHAFAQFYGNNTGDWQNFYFSGALDEVEIFNRVLKPAEIKGIYLASSNGKCRDHCYVPSVTPFCINESKKTIYVTICNESDNDVDYHMHLYPVSATGSCNFGGLQMTDFDPFCSDVLAVPKHQCRKVPVTISRPAGFGPGDVACYCAQLFNYDDGEMFECHGSIMGTSKWCPEHLPVPVSITLYDLLAVPIVVRNTGDSTNLFNYVISARTGCCPDSISSIVSLNRLPPGTDVTGSLLVPLNDSATLTVQAKLTRFEPFDFEEVVLLSDLDGDLVMEPLAAAALQPITFPDCNSNSVDDSVDIASGTSLDTNSNGFPDECEARAKGCPCCYMALGNAIVTPVDTTLVVSNIGPSGLDGVDAETDDDDGVWSIVWENPDPTGTFPVGASLGTEFFFATPTHPDSLSMRLSMTKAAANTWNLAVQSVASICSVKAFNNGSPVFSGVGIGTTGLGYIVETAKGVYPVGFKGGSDGKPAKVIASSDYDFTASPNGVQWTWPAHGVSNLTIDSLSISTEVPETSLVGVTHTTMCGDNGSKSAPISFTILNIEVKPSFKRGDANGDSKIDVSDVVYLINYLLKGGLSPHPMEAGDADCDWVVDVVDVVYLINYLYKGGPPPAC